jgi:hypothetical protein
MSKGYAKTKKNYHQREFHVHVFNERKIQALCNLSLTNRKKFS